ncbi:MULTISPECIES: hypothetical protein [unclassified Brevibacterium]|uniref:hypothetical protein n=1 Tax=unclassified Brevibacterium TaxID=2614124 RepID=UPI0010F68796|nr:MULTISPECIES: hypothetical protein [unclassified Brevibacterium]MCM1013339.1 hypothetical protein [Brevibacterium sp. XM4083]
MVTSDHPPGHVNGRLFSDAAHPTVLVTDFDVPGYLAAARGRITVDAEHLDLPAEAARDLGFLWRLENSALAETRAMLASWTANEARITAFVTAWGYERYWLARALREILDAGDAHRSPRAPRSLSSTLRGAWVERALPIVAPVLGGAVKEPITAGHMARLALQEGALQTAERALLPRLTGEAARVLAEVVDRRDEIVRFFRTEAIARITRSRSEALTARLHVAKPWAPLRIVGVPDPDEAVALSSLFTGSVARQELGDSDTVIGRLLPGNPQPSVAQVRAALRTARRADSPSAPAPTSRVRSENGV